MSKRWFSSFGILGAVAILSSELLGAMSYPAQAQSQAGFVLSGSVGSITHRNGLTLLDLGPGGHIDGHLARGSTDTSRIIVTGYTAYGDGRPLFERPTTNAQTGPNIITPTQCNDSGGIEVNGSCRYSLSTSFCGASLNIGGGVGHLHSGNFDIYFYHYINYNVSTCDWSAG